MTKNKKQTIPDGWQETTLDKIAYVNPITTLTKGSLSKKIAMENISPFTRHISSFTTEPFIGGVKFINRDTLVARITPSLENGKTSYVNFLKENEIAFGSTEFIVLREKEESSNDLFLYYLATSPTFRGIAIKSMTGTSGRQRVQTEIVSNHKFLFPQIQEQKIIAGVLSSFDDKIELLREQNKILEETTQTLFKHWFVDFEFPNKDGKPYKSSGSEMIDSELGEIPERWRVGGLSSIANFLNGIALQKFRPDKDGYLPVVKIKELKNGISEQTDKASKNIDKKYIISAGDIIFSWSGSLELTVWHLGKGALNQHLFKVTSAEYPKWFFFHWIQRHLTSLRQTASDKAVTMGHIKRHHLDDALVVIPGGKEIEVYDKTFSPLFQKHLDNNLQIQTLSKIRDILLPKLMRGEVRVKK